MNRQEFDKPSKRIMLKRATDEHGVVRCEQCKAVIKGRNFAYDHVVADSHKSDERKATRKLTADDGQLLCSGFEGSCHDIKSRKDTTVAAKLVRMDDKATGVVKSSGTLRSAGFARPQPKQRSDRIGHVDKSALPKLARRVCGILIEEFEQ